jgi:hypothetical protein
MRKAIVAMAAAGMLVLAGVGMTRADDGIGFGNANFRGVYPFSLHGTTIDTTNVPMAGGGILRADGKGKLSGSLKVNVGGAVCSSDISGSYSIASDGTGTATITATGCGSVPADYDVVMSNGWHISMFSADGGSVVGIHANRRRGDVR